MLCVSEGLPFLTAVDLFISTLAQSGRSPGTRQDHRKVLGRFGRWLHERGLLWSDVRLSDLRAHLSGKEDKSFATLRNTICTLRVFYGWAVCEGHIPASPAAGLKTPKTPEPIKQALSREEIRQLIDTLAGAQGAKERRDRALILTALYAGLRAKELAALTWSDLDFDELVIRIRLSKWGRGRSVPMHTSLCRELRAWREHQLGEVDSSWVFSLTHDPIVGNRAGKIARYWSQRSGVALHTHTLRHTFATWSLRRSRDLHGVSKSLGHRELKQTEIYLRSCVDDQRHAIRSLPDLLGW